MKFSIATLLILVLIAALGCAALINANALWRQTMVTLTLFAFVFSTIAAAVDRSRSFAIGFAIAGWSYFVVAFVPPIYLRDHLMTDTAINWLLTTMHEEDQTDQNIQFTPDGSRILTSGTDNAVRIWDIGNGKLVNVSTRQAFADIGHALWTLLIGLLGGVAGKLFAQKQVGPSD